MRIYIIGSDGIMLCRKAPATVNDGEIAVGSNEELHAAPLSARRLLALWNALPGVEKRRTVGDRGALIDRLWLNYATTSSRIDWLCAAKRASVWVTGGTRRWVKEENPHADLHHRQ